MNIGSLQWNFILFKNNGDLLLTDKQEETWKYRLSGEDWCCEYKVWLLFSSDNGYLNMFFWEASERNSWTETGIRSQGAVSPPPPGMKPSTERSVSEGLLLRLFISPKILISCVIISEGTSFNFSFFFFFFPACGTSFGCMRHRIKRRKEKSASDLDFWDSLNFLTNQTSLGTSLGSFFFFSSRTHLISSAYPRIIRQDNVGF